MVAHADFVAAFESAFEGQVFLVSRLADPALGLDGGTEVYIPDWHVVPKADADKYTGHVCWVGSCFLSTARNASIHKGHVGVRVGNDLRIYQLGYFPS